MSSFNQSRQAIRRARFAAIQEALGAATKPLTVDEIQQAVADLCGSPINRGYLFRMLEELAAAGAITVTRPSPLNTYGIAAKRSEAA
jgi:hypothetical protein